jgi:hypothetical protein
MGNKICFSGSSMKDLPDHCALISESNASFKLIPYQQFLCFWSKYLMRLSVSPYSSAVEVALIDVNWRGLRSKEGGKGQEDNDMRLLFTAALKCSIATAT